MSVKQKLMTAEALLEMPDTSGKNFELVDGEVIEVSPTNRRHGLIATRLSGILGDFVRRQDLGFVMGDNVGFVLRRDPDSVRAPDVSFVDWDSASLDDDLDRFVEGPPTLAVEVVSPHDRSRETHERVQDYLRAGTRQVWVLWPGTRSVTVHHPDGVARELGPDATLDGGNVLPGFSTPVAELFEVPHRRR